MQACPVEKELKGGKFCKKTQNFRAKREKFEFSKQSFPTLEDKTRHLPEILETKNFLQFGTR